MSAFCFRKCLRGARASVLPGRLQRVVGSSEPPVCLFFCSFFCRERGKKTSGPKRRAALQKSTAFSPEGPRRAPRQPCARACTHATTIACKQIGGRHTYMQCTRTRAPLGMHKQDLTRTHARSDASRGTRAFPPARPCGKIQAGQ